MSSPRYFMVVAPSFIADQLVATGSRITDAFLNGATPGTNLVEVDLSGRPVNEEDAPRLADALGTGTAGPVFVAPVGPHAPNPTHPQALPPQVAGGPQFVAGHLPGFTAAVGVESNEAAEARIAQLEAELERLRGAREAVDASSLEPEPPQRRGDGGLSEPSILDGSISALSEALDKITDRAEIDRLIAAEEGGKSRVGALEALRARQEALAQ